MGVKFLVIDLQRVDVVVVVVAAVAVVVVVVTKFVMNSGVQHPSAGTEPPFSGSAQRLETNLVSLSFFFFCVRLYKWLFFFLFSLPSSSSRDCHPSLSLTSPLMCRENGFTLCHSGMPGS